MSLISPAVGAENAHWQGQCFTGGIDSEGDREVVRISLSIEIVLGLGLGLGLGQKING